MNVVVEEPFSSGGLVSILIQPDHNLLMPLHREGTVDIRNRVQREGCEFSKSFEPEVDIYGISGWNNAPVGNYSTVMVVNMLRD